MVYYSLEGEDINASDLEWQKYVQKGAFHFNKPSDLRQHLIQNSEPSHQAQEEE